MAALTTPSQRRATDKTDEQTNEYNRKRREAYAANPEKWRALTNARYHANPEKHKARTSVPHKCSHCDVIVYTKASLCNSCYSAYRREWDKTHKPTGDWRLKVAARTKARNAVRDGSLKRHACTDCGNQKAEMHHVDYSRPLDVIWVCRTCHRLRHATATV